MPIIRVSPEIGGWFAFPRSATRAGLSWESLGLLTWLLEKGPDFEARFETIIEAGNAKDFKVRRMLKELEAAGYMKRQRFQNEDGTYDWSATVYDVPRSVCKDTSPKVGRGKPYREKRDMVQNEKNKLTISRKSRDIIETPESNSLTPTELTSSGSDSLPDQQGLPGLVEAVSWPDGLNKKQISALVAAGYSPVTVLEAKPEELFVVPGVGRTAVKAITGVDIHTQTAVSAAGQREIMAAYYEALNYTTAARKMVNGGREAASAKRLAEAGYAASTVVACYRYYKADGFWKDRHLSLSYIAQNIAAWIQAGKPGLPENRNGSNQSKRGISSIASREGQYSSGLDGISEAERERITAELRAVAGR